MSTSLAILTIGAVPMREMSPPLTEYIDEQHITYHSLLGQIQRGDVMTEYGASSGDELLLILPSNHQPVHVSRQKVERLLQGTMEAPDDQRFDVILPMSTVSITRLTACNSTLLEPICVIPPLVALIIEGHQVEVIVPVVELLKAQTQGQQVLQALSVYAAASPVEGSKRQLIDAGKYPLERGADALVPDCPGLHQCYRDLLQKSLDVLALLSNMLIA